MSVYQLHSLYFSKLSLLLFLSILIWNISLHIKGSHASFKVKLQCIENIQFFNMVSYVCCKNLPMFVARIFLVFYLHRIFKGLFMYILTQVVFMSIRIQRVRVCEWGALVCGWMHLPEVNLECCSSETDLVYWDRASHWHLGLTALDRLPGQQHPSIFLSVPPQCWKTKPVPQRLTFVHGLRGWTEVFRLTQEALYLLNHIPSQLKLLTWEPAPSL